jgi:N-acetylmuramoyl-L-alanine amidase
VFRYIVAAPSKVRLLHFDGKFRLVKDAAREVNAACAINMGFFAMASTHPVGSYPVGQVMVNGENLVWPNEHCGHFHGVYRKGGAVKFWQWLPDGCDWGVRAGPRLIEGGKVCRESIQDIQWAIGGVNATVKKPRVAIGELADRRVVLAYWDDLTIFEGAEKLLALGCVEALAGDGGGSASWYTPDVQIGARAVPNMIYVEGDAPAPRKTLKVYISPSQQPENLGVGDYGDEQTQMYHVAYILAARLTALPEARVMVASPGLTMASAVAGSNAWGADVHICLHSNASVKHNAVGCEVFYCPGSVVGKRLAERVYSKLCDENPHGGRRCAATGFYELKQTKAPAVYIETGFHDNAEEAEWIVRSSPTIAKAIGGAVCDEFMEV